MRNVNIEKWRGRRDAVALEPEKMAYTEQRAKGKCKGCLFERQWADICNRASDTAVRAGLTNCDHGVIYVAIAVDPRQLVIEAHV